MVPSANRYLEKIDAAAVQQTVNINVEINRETRSSRKRSKGAARGGAEGAQAPPLTIRILMFIFSVFHQHCTVSRDQVHCKMFFGSTTGVATYSLSNQAVMNLRFEKY